MTKRSKNVIMPEKFDSSFSIICMTKQKWSEMKLDDIGGQGVAI